MADDNLEELIPWSFYTSKTVADAELLAKINDQNDLERRITARKGWITKALHRVEADKIWFEKTKLTAIPDFSEMDDSPVLPPSSFLVTSTSILNPIRWRPVW